MAEQPQLLLEFTENLQSDLARGAITPQEAIGACQQYALLRETLSSQALPLTQATLEGDAELAAALHGILEETTEKLRALPGFQAQNPDEQKTEKDIRDTGFLRQHALTRVRNHTRIASDEYKKRRREFIHELVSKYSAFKPDAGENEVEKAFERATIASLENSEHIDAPSTFAERMSEELTKNLDTPLSQEHQEALNREMQEAALAHATYITHAADSIRAEQLFVQALYTHMEVKRPDVVADIFVHAPDDQKEEALIRGVKLAGVAESLDAYTNQPLTSGKLFTQDGAKGITKGLQQAADGLLSVAGEPVRDIVYKNKIAGVFRSMMQNTQELTDRLGTSFVQSALFTNIQQNLTKSLSQKRQAIGVGSVAGDVFSTVFRSPVYSASITRATKERVFDYFELARASAHAPEGYQFFKHDLPPWSIFSPAMAALREIKKRKNRGLSGSGAFSPGGVGKPTGIFSVFSRFPFIPVSVLGSLGYWTSRAISSGIDNATSFAFTNPALPAAIQRSRKAVAIRTPITQDLPLMIAITVIATLVILFIFPSPFNLAQIDSSSKLASLLESLIEKPEEEQEEIVCIGDCRWPTSGTITQGPNTNDSHKNDVRESIDIGASCGTAVHSTVNNAEVTAVFNGCTDNTGYIGNKCGGGWGNYIILRGEIQTGTNQTTTVSVRYSHLAQGSMPSVSSSVSIGQRIGNVDNNGNSSGCHLHYEVVGATPPINSILPYAVPSCVGRVQCCAQMLLAGNSCNVSP